jgi:cyclin L
MLSKLDDFYLTAEELDASPSRNDGVSSQVEAQLRHYGCDLIQQAAIALNLPQAVSATAQVLLQRFYCKKSLLAFDIKVIAVAVTWLACKLEEVLEIDKPDKLRFRDVLTCLHRLICRHEHVPNPPILDPHSNLYQDIKAAVVWGERHILRAFGFIVSVEHPHRFALTFGQLLDLDHQVLQQAWALCNDSLRTTLCVKYKAEVVACGVLFTACKMCGVGMPEQSGEEWWLLFDIEKSALLDVWGGLQELYCRSRPVYIVLKQDIIKATVPAAGGVDNNIIINNNKSKPPPLPPPLQQQQQRKVG